MDAFHHSLLKRRISVLCQEDERMSKKLFEAVKYAAQYNVYRDPYPDFSSPMLIILGLFYGLIRGDMELSKLMAKAASSQPQIRSNWLKVWLRDDFNFEEEDVAGAFTAATVLINNGLVDIPMYTYELFYCLCCKYEEMVVKFKPGRTI